MVDKIIDVEAKAGFQSPFGTREIDLRYTKKYKLLVKKNKNDAYWEQRDKATNKDKKKAKSHNSSSSTNQPPTQASSSKKHQEKRQESYPATGVNASKIAKKDKDKAKNLCHIKYYTCK